MSAAANGASAAKWLAAGAFGGTILGGLLMMFALRGEVEDEPAHVASGTASDAVTTAAGAPTSVAEPAAPAPPALPPPGDDGDDGGDERRHAGAAPIAAERAARLDSQHAAMQRPGGRTEPSRGPSRTAARGRSARRADGRPAPLSSSTSSSLRRAGASSRATSLEREVARLDAIRVANANGDFAKGIELVALYRTEFDHGELARDADVFEIEALAGEGERARAARAARVFLERYPDDPHAQRVRAVAAEVAP